MKVTRVLIVDDVTQVRQDLRTILTLSGDAEQSIEIVGEAANGQDAIGQVDALRPDVVLMDLEMPVLDGYEASYQIKARWPACRVIALTVHDYESARQKAFQARMDDFIVKGKPLETLVQAISGLESKE